MTEQTGTSPLEEAAKAVLNGVISWGSGPAAPCFDEFDREVESRRGRWAKVDGDALDRLREALRGSH